MVLVLNQVLQIYCVHQTFHYMFTQFLYIFDNPGAAGAVLHTALSLIEYLSDPFLQNL